jgi:molybdopterin-guanine dinucleotide biosynthesis protein A
VRNLPDAALILAGGAGRRLGGAAKPVLPVGGRPMLHRVLAAVAQVKIRIVVGPAELPLPPEILRTQEEPAGGGPVAAMATGLAQVPDEAADVAVLAADLPLLTEAAVVRLRNGTAGYDGAVYVDDTGRFQWLCGVWRVARLRAVLPPPEDAVGGSVRAVLSALRVRPMVAPGGPPVWWDCDTEAEWDEARRWADVGPAGVDGGGEPGAGGGPSNR